MSFGASPSPGGLPKGTQTPGSLWPGFMPGGAQGTSRAPAQSSTSGPDMAGAMEVVRRATNLLRMTLSSCADLNPIIAPVQALLQDAAKRQMLAANDTFQEFYGLLVVKVAESYLNVREDKDAKNKTHNTGKDVEDFQKTAGIAKGNAWCAAFAYTCHARAAAVLGGLTTAPKTGAASGMWYKSKNTNSLFTVSQVNTGDSAPRAGDLFVFEQVQDSTGAARKARDKRIQAAKLAHDAKINMARRGGTEGADLEAVRKAAAEVRDKEIGAAEAEFKKRAGGMKEGVKLGNNLDKDQGEFFASHTGIVKSFDKGTQKLVTIEGNTSDGEVGSREGDGVFERTDRMDRSGNGDRKYPQLYGFVRPKFQPA